MNASLLLEGARAGDEAAFEKLLALHDADVRASIVVNPKWHPILETEDVLQVTYMEAVLDLSRFEGDSSSLSSWLRAIAQNNLRDVIKGLEREKRPHPDQRVGPPPGQDSVVWLWNFLTGSSESPSGSVARDEMRATLDACIAQLPATYAHVIRLVDLQEHSLKEAACAMERTYGGTYLLHIRALDRLRRLLGSESQFFSD